jgi:hypothetical protein
MKVPTTGTSVFNTVLQTPSTYGVKINEGFPVDLLINGMQSGTGMPQYVESRLQGVNTTQDDSGDFPYLSTASTNDEVLQTWGLTQGWDNTGFYQRSILGVNIASWGFGRAPKFFDEVCYTGTGAAQNVSHNLTVIPELIIVKSRNNVSNWYVLNSMTGSTYSRLFLDAATAISSSAYGSSTALASQPTSTIIPFGSLSNVSFNGWTYVAYLFATCAGVSKVGGYTGTGSTQTINCGFTGGARWVMIKRTDSSGNWYVWDTARGMVSGTDPSLQMNSGASQSNANSVYTIATGFQLLASPAVDVNTNGGSYIFLAIA